MGFQEGIIGIFIVIIMYLTTINSVIQKENEELKDKLRYEKAYKDANDTRESTFESNKTEIEKVYNEDIKDINNTSVGDYIDFGLRIPR